MTSRYRILSCDREEFSQLRRELHRRAFPNPELAERVRSILERVRAKGDTALVELTRELDRVALSPSEFCRKDPPKRPAAAIHKALCWSLANVRRFARASRPKDWRIRNREGAWVGERFLPLERVGVYVPGGTAPLISTALMTIPFAREAGVREIAAVTPPPIDPVLYYALRSAGATEVYSLGGAQAVAALAYGTETIRPVDKIFGPGNSYVVEAKRQLFGLVAVDLLPGPSEVAVVADEHAQARFVAADLLAQAEHGPSSRILLLTPSRKVLEEVIAQIEEQTETLPRRSMVESVLRDHALFVSTRTLEEALELVGEFAPEHLSLAVRRPHEALRQVRHCGAIYLGSYSPVAAGDFLAGPSHTLPTGGSARAFDGLRMEHFFQRTSVLEYSKAALARVEPQIARFAQIEGLAAHGRSASVRLDRGIRAKEAGLLAEKGPFG
ncbi:histidinol dehydrogenase [Methylacidimicrobium cyclopophantes]|uniref:Histidinol dehydrogenase n=1 Tax=Methylacidimicrobium cyclopophantes TaxID=1041766 RepID=A0A5E6MF29_9BACT|nr:histidinol dehydrogenase [Methylacidimicrobium cyclopophantes]VVM07849.1 histidinol dehydrogenase [Methylacidimicrobium cyclopophantes]